MDADVFFKEATLRIYGSLKMEKALFHTFLYLKKFMPAEKAFLHHYDKSKATFTVSASADSQGGHCHRFKAI
ncbi:hypothetical protein [Dethiosulfatarculus sandiegensis]|uniref:hypothetical protein n=1 Tax=Dethiosulfatarculus sandiegensis TaxID=1429043 RepID=UPI0006982B9F|nr:hypothetical protein [Dethiosulfatarculus sandiegensis]